MGHIFKHNETNKLYTIEYLIRDIKHLNGNAFSGIYAYPWNWYGDIIKHTKDMYINREIVKYDPEKFVKDNFDMLYEI